jgi:hypothetical protein
VTSCFHIYCHSCRKFNYFLLRDHLLT